MYLSAHFVFKSGTFGFCEYKRMAEFMSEINSKYKEAEQIINKKNLSKDDQEKLKWFYQRMSQEIKQNIPFFVKCFQEVMDKVVLDAKSEIDSALLHSVVSAGIEALGININKPDKSIGDK